MKKILFAVLTALVFAGCSKENDEKTQSVMVNVFDGTDIASPVLVQLYDYNDAKDFDKEKSVSSMAEKRVLKSKGGADITPKYTSDNFSGVNIFNDIPDGSYILSVFYKESGYSFPMFYYYGFKEIVVKEGVNLHKISFIHTTMSRGMFIRFN